MTLAEALVQAQTTIAPSSDSARLDAGILLAHVLGLSRTQLRMRGDDELSDADHSRLVELSRRRSGGEPIAYLTGSQPFWTLDLLVTPSVLVPRPETELLVEWALELLPASEPRGVVDLGTGSGAIGLSIAAERALADVVLSDISQEALAIARSNASRANLVVNFRQGHWWRALADARFDLAVSNPPYIAEADPHLSALHHEPLLALSDGGDGLQALRDIIAGAPAHLNAGGCLLVEHGCDQGEPVRALFDAAGFVSIATRRDLEGRERATGGQRA